MARKTGVQENRGYTQTDDFITRTHILPLLTNKAKRQELINEHLHNTYVSFQIYVTILYDYTVVFINPLSG